MILTVRLAGFFSVRFMEHTCLLSKQRFPQHGIGGFAIYSKGCHLATKPLLWPGGQRAKEQSGIWVNGTLIQKIIPIHLV